MPRGIKGPGGRPVDHPRHKEWLAEQLAYVKRRRAEKIAAGEIPEVRPRGRPMKERCICPNCGSEHIKKSGPTWEVMRVERGWHLKKKMKNVQLPIHWGGEE